MVAQARVGGAQDRGDQAQLGHGRVEGGEHEVADAQRGQAGHCWGAEGGWEDEQEHLADVVVALEVAEVGVAAEDFDDEV